MACDETLPPRLSDPNAMEITAALEKGTCTIDSGKAYGAGAIDIRCTNTYYEVLSDSAQVSVEIDLWLVEHPEARAHVRVDAGALTDSTLIAKGLLTLIPGLPARLYHQWEHRTSGNVPFYSYLKLTTVFNPLRGITYLVSDTTTLAMQGSVQFFKKIPAYTIPPTQARIVYEIY